MKNKKTSEKKRISRIRCTLVMLIIPVLILVPLASNAAQDDPKVSYSHGTLKVAANDIIISSSSNVTEDEIIKLAKPSATHTYNSEGIMDQPVEANYSVSEDDLRLLNDSMGNGNKVKVTIQGIYMYFCPICKDDQPIAGKVDIMVSFIKTYNYKVTFKANGGKIDGKSQKVVIVSSENNDEAHINTDLMPKSPKKKNCTFKGWSKSSQKYVKFSMNTPIKSDITVYAYWTHRDKKKDENTNNRNDNGDINKKVKVLSEDETISHVATITKNYQISKSDFANNDGEENNADKGNGDELNQAYISAAEFASIAASQDIPVTHIGKGNVPLYSPKGSSGWAFANLLFAVMTAIMMLISVIIGIRQGKTKRTIWFVLPIICSIATVILFLITENIKLNMVMVDRWTVISSVLFAVTVISTILFLKKEEEFEDYIFKY